MLNILTKIPQYRFAKRVGIDSPMPINYTLGLTYKCQAKCKTCNIRVRPSSDEMSPWEWHNIFESIGTSPYWVTLTGGEPFLYPHLQDVFFRLVTTCKPKIVNIPTNGQMTERILERLKDFATFTSETEINVNVSIDHDNASVNDEIRGIKGYTRHAIETIWGIEALQKTYPNICLGIHTVISNYNVLDFPQIQRNLKYWIPSPDNYITEIAENREELHTMEDDITPSGNDYETAIQSLLNSGHGLKQAFRHQYYRNVIKILKRQETIPCYAGFASCQITPDGDIWGCCIKSDVMGNLRQSNYDFRAVWHSEQANSVRRRTRNCYCPMANVSYTNMLMDIPTMFRIAKELAL